MSNNAKRVLSQFTLPVQLAVDKAEKTLEQTVFTAEFKGIKIVMSGKMELEELVVPELSEESVAHLKACLNTVIRESHKARTETANNLSRQFAGVDLAGRK